MKTAPTNKKIRELISMVDEGKLIPRPEFQRRLVWTHTDKNNFLDTILRGFPFPELYLADGDVDLETGKGSQLLVDGLQRVSTIIQYFRGDSELRLTTIPPYKDLEDDDKKRYLQYDVAVRDLGSVTKEEIIEVFRRINATQYSLLEIEINNAIYAGALKQYAEKVSSYEFFDVHRTFSSLDLKRMGDLRYALLIIITMIQGYFNRDDAFGDLLARYNDEFPLAKQVNDRLQNILSFIEECGFEPKERVWRKADLFTLIIELDQHMNIKGNKIQPSEAVEYLQKFYSRIDPSSINESTLPGVYYKAALQASNDKVNRIRRGITIYGVLDGQADDQIIGELVRAGLL